jgi:hypothetical protein
MEWRRTFKLGDARPLICSLVKWRLSHCPPLHTCYDQYITSLKHPLSVGAVQADFHSALRRPVQARVRQARVLCCAAFWFCPLTQHWIHMHQCTSFGLRAAPKQFALATFENRRLNLIPTSTVPLAPHTVAPETEPIPPVATALVGKLSNS